MSKRILSIMAIVLLAAACLGGQVAMAATAPATSEQAAVVIEPGQIGQIPLRLNAGDAASGHVSVTPEGINLLIRDPEGQLVLNAGMITEKDFSFTAASSGIYQFVLANSSFLTANKIVLVQVQHPGAPVWPYFSGSYVAIKPADTKTVTLSMDAYQTISGNFRILGGQQDIAFAINDPAGGTAISAGTVRDSYSFNFTPATAGDYKLSFSNTSSAYISKLILLEVKVDGRPWWWGSAARLVFSAPPAGGKAGSEFTSQPAVIVQDASGAQASNYFDTVTITITSGTGIGGAVLSGTASVKAVAGLAVFSGLSIDLPGAGYTLTASSGKLTPAVSSAFDVSRLLPANCVALNAGWNLMSLPLTPDDPAIATILAGISGSVLSVWHYDTASANWSSYVPSVGGTLATMTDGKAYWINMSAPAILTLDSRELTTKLTKPPAYQVIPGWNMIGFKSTLPASIGVYLAGTNYRPFPIYGYASGSAFAISSSSSMLQSGLGYWVYFNSAGSIKP
ncbi:MAG: emp24/gp25L/p24 family protein [Dehalococcoidales bacterium]|nr:emp24/gp25L/p24 family protein [Dehalococcoidales bacterium]